MTPTPQRWRDTARERAAGAVEVSALGHLVVVAAHPDDETLAAAGLLRAAHAAGARVELVVATDGEAALPEVTGLDRAELGRTRRAELHTALDRLGLGTTPVTWLGMPDSALDADDLTAALRPFLRDADACLAPWEHDPHPDHAAAGRAAAAAAPEGVRGWGYPIWACTAVEPDHPSIPWPQADRHVLDDGDRAAKRHAIDAFVSQTTPLATGGRAVLPPEVLEHFRGDGELFFRSPGAGRAPRHRR
ncbi:LmbE family N-acetylglucosaminyl deacetylase [Pseudonocardia sediminis]|uniref:LmbE family N-acetylglucosaminyl deacetylase n=1 Tax=Pseudonocardia sediminis TaxID=1397368 RepID=A0A4V2FR47_PSEST|nr:PIG-L family deacetylase [Pseudonocardia sediminis]RZT87250.1 LmbE family N-acetylglucosaminyl deacetylase [Pseudonocardia sediminis]